MTTNPRPWPRPARPWVMMQVWRDVLFAHWRIPVSELRLLVPAPLEIEEFDGSAWMGVIAFEITGLRARGLPEALALPPFPEINVRTYVTVDGKPGVYFFSLDASNVAAVAGARLTFMLPYFLTAAHLTSEGDIRIIESARVGTARPARLHARYRPTGQPAEAVSGSLGFFLTERYCLYTVDPRGRPYRVEIDHPPWPLQSVEAEISINSMTEPLGLLLPDEPPVLHFAVRQDAQTWLIKRIR